jgi:hypothetical protein
MIEFKGCSISKHIYQNVILLFKLSVPTINEYPKEFMADIDLLKGIADKLGGTEKHDNVAPGVWDAQIYFDLTALAFPDTTEGCISQQELGEIEMHMMDALNHTAPRIKELWETVIARSIVNPPKADKAELCGTVTPIKKCSTCGNLQTDGIHCNKSMGCGIDTFDNWEPKASSQGFTERTEPSTDIPPVQFDAKLPYSEGEVPVQGHMVQLKAQSANFAKPYGTQKSVTRKSKDRLAAQRIALYYKEFRKTMSNEEAAMLAIVTVTYQ